MLILFRDFQNEFLTEAVATTALINIKKDIQLINNILVFNR